MVESGWGAGGGDVAPYRLLEDEVKLSAGAADAGNMLIQGDNLKSLLPVFAARMKGINSVTKKKNRHPCLFSWAINMMESLKLK